MIEALKVPSLGCSAEFSLTTIICRKAKKRYGAAWRSQLNKTILSLFVSSKDGENSMITCPSIKNKITAFQREGERERESSWIFFLGLASRSGHLRNNLVS